MTIAFVASSNNTTATAARGTTSISVAYTSVAAGRIAIIAAEGKQPASTTWGTAPAGFTLLADVTGGATGTAQDNGSTRLGIWYRVLDGTETGSVTVSLNSGTQLTATMSVYSRTSNSWATPIFVSGQQTTTAANWSITMGAWASTLAAGDMLFTAYAANTDATSAVSPSALTQSGATFGTYSVTRSRMGGSDGAQGAIITWDVSVTTGSANAATFAGTWTASSAGVAALVRLREQTVTVVTGTAALSSETTLNAVPKNTVLATTALSGDTTIAPVSKVTTSGVAALSSDTTFTVIGARAVNGIATLSSETTLAVIGVRSALGIVTLSSETTFSALAKATSFGVSVLSGQTTLTGLAKATQFGVSVLSGQTTFTALAKANQFGASVLSGQTTLVVPSTVVVFGISAQSGQTVMSIVATTQTTPPSSILSGQSTLTAIGAVTVKAQTALDANSSIAVLARVTTTGVAALSGLGSITAIGIRKTFGVVGLNGQTILVVVGKIPAIIQGTVLFSAESDIQSIRASTIPPWTFKLIESAGALQIRTSVSGENQNRAKQPVSIERQSTTEHGLQSTVSIVEGG